MILIMRLWLIIALLLLHLSSALAKTPQPISSQVSWAIGDNLDLAMPGSDKNNWRTDPSLLPNPSLFEPSIYWRRQWLNLNNLENYQDPALLLGKLGKADEVFLNGVRIGRSGVVGNNPIEAVWIERIYRIPPNLLQPNNLLVIKMQIPYLKLSTITTPQLGEWSELSLLKYQRETPRRITEILMTSCTLIIFILVIMFRSDGSKLANLTSVANLIFLSIYHSDSLIAHDYLNTQLLAYLGDISLALFPALIIQWILMILGLQSVMRHTLFITSFLILALGFAVSWNFFVYQLLSLCWIILSAAALIIIILDIWQAWKIRGTEIRSVIMIVLIVISMAILYLLDLLEWWHPPPLFWNYPAVIILPLLDLATLQIIRRDYHNNAQATKRLAGQLLTVQEQERQSLSRELHDSLAQDLSSIKLNLGLSLMRLQHQEISSTQTLLETTIDLTQDAINELRSLIRDLRPLYLETLTLNEALQTVVQRFERITDISVNLQLDHEINLQFEQRVHLIRIVQEALANIAKHAHASSVNIYFGRHLFGWLLIIRDNGCGFDSSKIHNGLGLITLRERTLLMKGMISINSHVGEGVEIKLELPA